MADTHDFGPVTWTRKSRTQQPRGQREHAAHALTIMAVRLLAR
jgi:hypothetical protein